MRRHPGGCVSQRSDCLRALMLRIGYLTLLAARAVVARVGGMRRADKTPGTNIIAAATETTGLQLSCAGDGGRAREVRSSPPPYRQLHCASALLRTCALSCTTGVAFCRHQLRIRIGTGSRVAAAWTLESSSVHQPELSMTTGRRLGQLDHKEDSSNIKRLSSLR